MTLKVIRAADLFCGAGGASTGLVRSAALLGLKLDLLAINHWPIAVETHSLNHPGVRHLCESVERINPRDVIPGGRLHLLMAGPECTHFSTARGGRPVKEQSRASAWHILKWAQELYIDTILIENVQEFRTWGPIGANGQPLKSRKGETYRAFLTALASLGYRVEDRVLCAADYGDPTTRQRLFILARRGRLALRWPTATHSKTGSPTLFGTTQKWRPARDIIDWSVKGKSIFGRKTPLKPATIRRIMAGLEKFGGPDLQPFLVILRNHMAGRSIDQPLPTVAAQGGHVALAEPFLIRYNSEKSGQRGNVHSLSEPVGTITADPRFGLAQPFLMPVTHGQDDGRARSVDTPLPTITAAKRGELALIESFVLQQQSGGVPRSTNDPLPTISVKGAISIVQPFIVPHRNFSGGDVIDSVERPLRTITAAGGRRFGLAQSFLIPFYGERDGQEPRTHSLDEPVPTIPASGDGKFAVIEPFIFANRTHNAPKSIDGPIPPLCTGNHIAVVEPYLVKYNGTATAQSVDEPIDTIPTKDRFGLVQPCLDGYVLDIHFRMLQPHELALATSFPKGYQFRGTREDQVKQIGNAWPGELAMALAGEQLLDYLSTERKVSLMATA